MRFCLANLRKICEYPPRSDLSKYVYDKRFVFNDGIENRKYFLTRCEAKPLVFVLIGIFDASGVCSSLSRGIAQQFRRFWLDQSGGTEMIAESLRLRVAARESDPQVPFSKFADFERHRHEQAKNIGEVYTKRQNPRFYTDRTTP
jgi:2-phosphoglycerate kinase